MSIEKKMEHIRGLYNEAANGFIGELERTHGGHDVGRVEIAAQYHALINEMLADYVRIMQRGDEFAALLVDISKRAGGLADDLGADY